MIEDVRRAEQPREHSRYPFAVLPNGWFAVAFADELRPGVVLARRYLDQDMVLFRTMSGTACAVEAYCPHLGAHLGHGGSVEGEHLRCPFHHFCFDTSGVCVSTPYATKVPPRARHRTWPLHEANGMLFIYHDSSGRQPGWHVVERDAAGWTRPLTHCWTLPTHPQDTVENAVDLGHLRVVHGYEAVEVLRELVTEGPYLNVRYAMLRPADLFGRSSRRLRAEFDVHVYGLGLSVVEVFVPAYELHTRHIVCATPIDGEHLDLRVAVSIRELARPELFSPALRWLPRAQATRLVARMVFRGFVHDLRQDFPMWEHKRYIERPALAAGDGPIGRYRQWARQFYSEPERAAEV